MPKKLTGVIPPLMIPLDANLNTDFSAVKKIVDRAIDRGVSGLFVLGGMGEGQYVRDSTKKDMVEATVKAARGRVPVLAGISAESPCKVMDNAAAAIEAGADYLVCLPLYYYGYPSQDAVAEFFIHIADQISVPLVIYNNPIMTGTAISCDCFCRLAEHPNIAGTKDSSGDGGLFMELMRRLKGRDDFFVFHGGEFMMDGAMRMGADGLVPGGGTLLPELFVELYQTGLAGDYEKTMQQQQHISDCLNAVYLDGCWAWVRGQKYALSALGLCEDYCAIGDRALTENEKATVRENMKKLGIY